MAGLYGATPEAAGLAKRPEVQVKVAEYRALTCLDAGRPVALEAVVERFELA